MKAFEYASPTSADDAVKDLAGPSSVEALSGGTDLISRMKDYVSSPARVVYLKDIKALSGIAERAGGLEIGAGTRLADVVANPLVKERYPALRQATLEVGTPQIRNMATVGGNLLQRPRCWYFRGRLRPARDQGRQEPGPRRRQPLSLDLPHRRRRPLRQPVEPGRPPHRPQRRSDDPRPPGDAGRSPSRSSTGSPGRTTTGS